MEQKGGGRLREWDPCIGITKSISISIYHIQLIIVLCTVSVYLCLCMKAGVEFFACSIPWMLRKLQIWSTLGRRVFGLGMFKLK